MKSLVELDIDLPQEKLAELFADPRNNPKWMDDLARIEPVRGELGEAGSVYRMVPKQGPVFVATVLSRRLPEELRLSLESPGITVAVNGRLIRLSERQTRLVSEETFEFEGAFNKVSGFIAQKAIKAAHRRHMQAFKRFAERQR
jgi:polyketide cyclase/dehydrase/lipid transport protein